MQPSDSSQMCTQKHAKRGFTLIEMSIVLVVIGLIVAAIFVGQPLIRQSQISSSEMDEQRLVQAVQQFQQKYSYLPGDFPNATSYWGAMTTCPPANGSVLFPAARSPAMATATARFIRVTPMSCFTRGSIL